MGGFLHMQYTGTNPQRFWTGLKYSTFSHRQKLIWYDLQGALRKFIFPFDHSIHVVLVTKPSTPWTPNEPNAYYLIMHQILLLLWPFNRSLEHTITFHVWVEVPVANRARASLVEEILSHTMLLSVNLGQGIRGQPSANQRPRQGRGGERGGETGGPGRGTARQATDRPALLQMKCV